MPRDGSPKRPAGGAVPLAPMDIGEVANPPFAVLPDPSSIFLRRAERFAVLAPGHELEPYLVLLSQMTRAQHDIIAALPAPTLPPAERLALARDNAMPPISTGQIALDEAADRTFEAAPGRAGGRRSRGYLARHSRRRRERRSRGTPRDDASGHPR